VVVVKDSRSKYQKGQLQLIRASLLVYKLIGVATIHPILLTWKGFVYYTLRFLETDQDFISPTYSLKFTLNVTVEVIYAFSYALEIFSLSGSIPNLKQVKSGYSPRSTVNPISNVLSTMVTCPPF